MAWYHEASDNSDPGHWHRQFNTKGGRSRIPKMLDAENLEWAKKHQEYEDVSDEIKNARFVQMGAPLWRANDPESHELTTYEEHEAFRKNVQQRIPKAMKLLQKYNSRITKEDIVGGLKAEDYPNGVLPPMFDHLIDKIVTNPPQDYREVRRSDWQRVGTQLLEDLGQFKIPRGQEKRDAAAEDMKNSTPAIQMPFSAFKKFLVDGEVKNMHQTNKSAAQDEYYGKSEKEEYERNRSRAEYLQFGSFGNEKSPVYGYMDKNDDRKKDFDRNDAEDCKTVLKSIYKSRFDNLGNDYQKQHAISHNKAIDEDPDSMYMIVPRKGGDPQDRYIASAKHIIEMHDYYKDDRASTEKKYRFFPLGDGNGNLDFDQCKSMASITPIDVESYYGDVKLLFKRHVLDHATVCDDDSTNSASSGDTSVVMPARMVENADPRIPTLTGPGAFEVQYHKHPTLDDVDKVHFLGSNLPSKNAQKVLADRGIEWEHASPLPPREHTLDQVYQQAGVKRTLWP